MQELINKYIQSNQFGKLIGMDFTIIEPGKIEYKLLISKEHLATPNAAHGGVIAALMDGLLGVTGLSAVAAEGKVVSTMEYKISYFNPAFLNDQLLGTGIIEKKGIAYGGAELYGLELDIIDTPNGATFVFNDLDFIID
jgi:uncharacterized protein (TIGR00369 family)